MKKGYFMKPKIGDSRVNVTVSDEDLAKIDEIAKRHKLKRSQVVRNLTKVGLDVYDELNMVGIVPAYDLYRKCSVWLERQKSFKQMKLF